jgi:chemotaxis protein CheX
LLKATEDIFESVIGESLKCKLPVERSLDNSVGETSVIISFVGSVSGAVTLKCSNTFASKIASQMLGMEVAAGSEEMKDAVGEMLNMIMGTAKSYYSSEGDPFKISIPTTVIGEDYSVHIKASPGDTVSYLDFSCNGDTMGLEVYLK